MTHPPTDPGNNPDTRSGSPTRDPANTTDLRSAFGSFLTGVTIVTTSDDGKPMGFTANSFTSVSLEPPLLLVSLSNDLNCLSAFENNEHFAVNVLSADQQSLSNTFASYDGDRFEGISHRPGKHNSPLLEGVCAWFDCVVHKRIVAGDHTLYIGEILDFDFQEITGLGYSRKGYFSLHHEQLASDLRQMSGELTTGYIIEQNHHLVVRNTGMQLELPTTGDHTSLKQLHESLEKNGVKREAGMLYSMFQFNSTESHAVYYRARGSFTDLSEYGSDGASGAEFVTCAIDDLPLELFESAAVRSMLKRFKHEHAMGVYGIYHGTEVAGEVMLLENTDSLPYSV